MKRPFETVRETFFENLERVRENQKYNFSNSDKYMIWIVGFSIGGLSIIVTNLSSFNQIFSHFVLKIVLILLCSSIVSGIVYRWAFYVYQVLYQNTEFYLQGAFSDKEIMEINPDDLTKETDIKEVIRRINIDFGEDVSRMLEIYNKVDENGKRLLLDELKSHYKRTGDWAKKEFEFSMQYIKDTFKKAYGISGERIDKMLKSNSGKQLKFWARIVTISFLLSCLCFIAVIVLLTILY